MARYDFHLAPAEFEALSVPQFYALYKRKWEQHRRDCYYAGIVASTDANLNRASDSSFISPMLFVPGTVVDPEIERKKRVKRNIRNLMSIHKPRTKADTIKLRTNIIKGLVKAGHRDAEQLYAETFQEQK